MEEEPPKKAVHVKWKGKTIALGTFAVDIALDKCTQAKQWVKTWKAEEEGENGIRHDIEWVKAQLEEKGLRIVLKRPQNRREGLPVGSGIILNTPRVRTPAENFDKTKRLRPSYDARLFAGLPNEKAMQKMHAASIAANPSAPPSTTTSNGPITGNWPYPIPGNNVTAQSTMYYPALARSQGGKRGRILTTSEPYVPFDLREPEGGSHFDLRKPGGGSQGRESDEIPLGLYASQQQNDRDHNESGLHYLVGAGAHESQMSDAWQNSQQSSVHSSASSSKPPFYPAPNAAPSADPKHTNTPYSSAPAYHIQQELKPASSVAPSLMHPPFQKSPSPSPSPCDPPNGETGNPFPPPVEVSEEQYAVIMQFINTYKDMYEAEVAVTAQLRERICQLEGRRGEGR